MRYGIIGSLVFLALLGGGLFSLLDRGGETRPLENFSAPGENWTAYLQRLNDTPLRESRIAVRWQEAAEEALRYSVPIETPHREAVLLQEGEELAISLRLEARRGQEIRISIDGVTGGVGELLFLDILERDHRYGGFLNLLQGGRTHTTGRGEALRFTAPRDGEYLLRFQAKPLHPVSFSLSVTLGPAYTFPVAGASNRDIWSVFGDSRGGGTRIHHGVDIFAPRGTEVLAATDAYVARVGTRSLGGKIVTLHDQQRDIYLYYAHLDDWIAEEGTFVRAGEPIGTVGNTGNARSTAPHLHIGLYNGWWSRPIDPWNFFVSPGQAPRPLGELPLADLGERRSLGAGVEAQLYTDGVPRRRVLSEPEEVTVIALSDDSARVLFEDGIPALVSREQLR